MEEDTQDIPEHPIQKGRDQEGVHLQGGERPPEEHHPEHCQKTDKGVLRRRETNAPGRFPRRGGVMAHQIIKQPNGKFGLWSSIVDDYVLINADKEDIVKYELCIKKKELEMFIGDRISRLNQGVQFPFCYNWDSSLNQIKEIHGEKAVEKLLGDIECK